LGPVRGPLSGLLRKTPAAFSVSHCGDRFAFSQRTLAYHRPVYAAALPDSQPRRFYLRLESDSSLRQPDL